MDYADVRPVVSPPAPATQPAVGSYPGQVWVNPTTGAISVWNGTLWVLLNSNQLPAATKTGQLLGSTAAGSTVWKPTDDIFLGVY